MTEQYFHIKTNGDFTLGKFDGLEPKQEAVGGLIERVWLSDDRHMWANEEGLLQKLPINEVASKMTGQLIVGDVLLIDDKNKVSLTNLIDITARMQMRNQMKHDEEKHCKLR